MPPRGLRRAILPRVNPWLIELIVVRARTHGDAERRSLARDVTRGLLVRVRLGVYVDSGAWKAVGIDGQHVVRMRALAAVAGRPPVFSHWSAALVHGLAFMRPGSSDVHVTDPDPAQRGRKGVAGHVRALGREEVVRVGELLVTALPRTVVDVAAASAFEDGVVIADGALSAGLPRELLEEAVDLAGPRHGGVRAARAIAFGHPGGESAGESRSRTTMFVLGVEPPDLQVAIWDEQGLAGVVDGCWRRLRAVGEMDGAKKFLDPKLAPKGAGQVLYDEKRREDRVRAQASALARWGWVEACTARLLQPILARIGVLPLERPPTLGDWAALARSARPRRPRLGSTPR